PPSTITGMMAMGVSHSRMFSWSEVTPVRNGDACANTRVGVPASRNIGMCLMRIISSIFLRQFAWTPALRIEFLTLGRTWSAKPEGFEDERVVVLFLP